MPVMTPKTDAEYLQLMSGFAKALKAAAIDHAEWALEQRYIRINGSGLRPISICQNNPCGALDGHGTYKKVGASLRDARRAGIEVKEKKPNKPEHRLQACLIEHALRSPETLPSLLHLTGECDELRLVTDELRVNDIRADVVLLGRKGDRWFPVFVELKVTRSLGRLLQQLNGIVDKVKDEATSAAFLEFAANATGVYAEIDPGEIDLDRAIKMVIWPALADGTKTPDSTEKRIPHGVRIIEYPKHLITQEAIPHLGLNFSQFYRTHPP